MAKKVYMRIVIKIIMIIRIAIIIVKMQILKLRMLIQKHKLKYKINFIQIKMVIMLK
jgi:hypothetical protein